MNCIFGNIINVINIIKFENRVDALFISPTVIYPIDLNGKTKSICEMSKLHLRFSVAAVLTLDSLTCPPLASVLLRYQVCPPGSAFGTPGSAFGTPGSALGTPGSALGPPGTCCLRPPPLTRTLDNWPRKEVLPRHSET